MAWHFTQLKTFTIDRMPHFEGLKPLLSEQWWGICTGMEVCVGGIRGGVG